jgi:RHS repeat-associated protein
MCRSRVGSVTSFARFWRIAPASFFAPVLAVIFVAAGTAFAPAAPANAAVAPLRLTTPVAAPGRGPVSRPLPASATSNHGYPKGTRPPVVPAGLQPAGPPHKLSTQDWARVPKPASGQAPLGPSLAGTDGAVNLILRSGFDFNDTSLVLYFDAADPGISGWQSWKATVFDPGTGAGQDSRQLQPSDAGLCQVPATYCRSFGSADGWSLVGGHQYFVTITVTFADATQAVSAASALATARTTSDPPTLPAAQVAGCACGDVLFPTTLGQVVRGSGVNTASGAFASTWPDLQAAGFGVTFNSRRTYSSANTTAGRFGVGWSWSYDIKVIPPSAGQTSVTVRADDGAQAVYTAGSSGGYNRPAGVRSNLNAVSGGGWRLVTPVQTAYSFDPTGRLTSIVDAHGRGLTFTYTASAITITDATGRVMTGGLNSAGLLTKLALPDKRNVIYKYTNGMLTSAQDAASNTWSFGYTGGLLTSIVDPQGRTQLTNTYTAGRVTGQVDASGAATTFSWNAAKQESTTTDADGVVYFDGYRGNSWVYSQNGNGDTTNQRYDAEVDPNLLVDPQGNQTASAYDATSNLVSMTAPDPFTFQVANTFDARNNLTTHTDALGHVARFGYTATDEVASIIAPTGDDTELTYDGRGLLTKLTDPRGKVTSLGYDAAGNLISQTSPLGEVTTYTYDSSGRLLTRVDPRGNLPGARAIDFTTTYSYDNLDRVTAVLQPRKAHASTTTYDSVGQVTATADPLGHTIRYGYDVVIGRTTTVTDANGGITLYTYSAAGRRTSVTDQVGDKTTMAYDNRGNIATVTSPRGNVTGANPADFTTTYTYDFNGNGIRTSHPYPGGGNTIRDIAFDQLDRPTTLTDPLGRTSTTGYDNNGDVTSTADPLGGTTTYSYDVSGRPTAVTAPGGGSRGTVYDAAGNVIKSTSPSGGVSTYTYDNDNRIASVVDPRGNASGANPADYTLSYGYDAAGDLTTVTDQLGKTTTFAYDSTKRVTGLTDANGHSVTYKYLDDDTLQSVVGPDGNTQQATTYSYDNAGNVVSRTDAKGNTRFTFDKLGRITDIKDPLNRDTLFSYDAEGNLVQSVAPGDTDPRTRTIAYTYDILNRLTRQDQAAGSLIYTRGYDANNNTTSLADPTGVRTQGYDSLNRLTSVGRNGLAFSYGYDSDGNVTSRTWPDGTGITAGYNPAGQLASLTVQDGQAGATAAKYTFAYDPSGRLTKTTYPTANHLVTDRSYDRAGRISDLNSHSDAGTVARYQVSRDSMGNPTGITTIRGSNSQHVAYGYDVFDRLTAACVGADCGASATGKIAYGYDEVGNRLSQTLSGSAGNSQTSYTYDSASELTGATVTTPSGTSSIAYGYNRSGDLVQAGADSFTYNLDHTLASATVGGTATGYAYDAQGIQLSASSTGSGAQIRTWQTDVNNSLPLLAEQTTTVGGTSTTQGFLDNPADGTPLGLLTGGQTDSFAPDTLHGGANVVNPAGATLAAYDFDPFGNRRTDGTAAGGSGSIANPVGFAGAFLDSTLGGRYSMLARNYDPGTGRFGGVDPVSPSIRQPAVSTYAYAANRPTSFRDPSGAAPCSSNDDHDDAQLFALDLFAAQYGRFNVYGDCPGWRVYQGRVGRISLATTVPAANPDILVARPGATLLYEVKPAADQLSEISPGLGLRGDNNAAQVQRYLYALAYAGYPNPQPGPNIVPASRQTADGSTLTIFSGADWKTFAPAGKRPTIKNSGIIYYVKTRPPRVPVPPPVIQKTPGDQQTQEPKEDPRDIPTTVPSDDPVLSDVGTDILVGVGIAALVVIAIALLPEEAVAAAGVAIVGGLVALGNWAFG